MKCCPLLPWRSVPRDKCRDGDLFCSSNHSEFLHFQGVVPAFCLAQGLEVRIWRERQLAEKELA